MNNYIKMDVKEISYVNDRYFGKWHIKVILYYQFAEGFQGTCYPIMEVYTDKRPSYESILEVAIDLWNNETSNSIICRFSGWSDLDHNRIAKRNIEEKCKEFSNDKRSRVYEVVTIKNGKILK